MGLLKNLMKKKTTTANVDPAIYSPLTGKSVPLSQVNDPVFAEEMMGEGAAILPTVGEVLAPCDGEVLTVFRTLHAITFKGDNGSEIIIHVGLETVALDGEHYVAHVKDGQRVKKGDLLLGFDIEQLKAKGYDVITPVIVTNSSDYTRVEKTEQDHVQAGDLFLHLG